MKRLDELLNHNLRTADTTSNGSGPIAELNFDYAYLADKNVQSETTLGGFLAASSFTAKPLNHNELTSIDEDATELDDKDEIQYYHRQSSVRKKPEDLQGLAVDKTRVRQLLEDHVYAVSDDNGNLLEHYRYTAFGEVEIFDANTQNKLAGSAIGNPVLWNSRRFDEQSGLYYYKYRHYKADIGRWLGRDPIEERGGVNLYGFVGSSPFSFWDKLGTKIITDCPIDDYLKSKGLDGHYTRMKSINTGEYHYIAGRDKEGSTNLIDNFKGLEALILTRMIKSSEKFRIKESAPGKEKLELAKHVSVRMKILENVKNAQFAFGTGRGLPMLRLSNGVGILPSSEGEPQQYYDLFNNDSSNIIGCRLGIKLIFQAAIGQWSGGYRSRSVKKTGVHIPGDWGYIRNKANAPVNSVWTDGEEGENVIHIGIKYDTGTDLFWGHFGDTTKDGLTMDEWLRQIGGWTAIDGTEATPVWSHGWLGGRWLESKVKYPSEGLE